MQDIIAIQPRKKRYLTINWQVNNWCNFKCSYCNVFSNGGDYKNNDKIDQSIRVFEQLIRQYQRKGINNFFLKITGGEPSMWKGTSAVVKKFREVVDTKNRLVSLNTNLSREINWWEENYYLFDIVIGSYHSEFTDNDHYLKVTNFLQDKVNLKSKIMMNKKDFDKCLDIANKIKETCSNYRIEYTPVLASLTSNVEPYYYEKQEHLDFFKTHSNEDKSDKNTIPNLFEMDAVTINQDIVHYTDNEIIINRKNSFLNWDCDIYENLFIHRDGKITQSTCGLGLIIGNIFEGLTNTDLKSITCTKQWCHCGVDIMNSKRKVTA